MSGANFALLAITGTLFFYLICLGFAFWGTDYQPVQNMEIFYRLIVLHDLSAVYFHLIILSTVFLFRPFSLFQKVINFVSKNPIAITLLTTVVLAACSLTVYHNHPLSMDEYIVRFQSKVFASGHITGSFPPVLVDRLHPFDPPFLLSSSESGKVFAKYWPGFILLLTPFEFLGIPWLLNPLLFSGTLLLLNYVAKTIFPDDPLAGGWAMLLALASPQLIISSISFYTMPGHLFFNLAFSALILHPRPFKCFCAGVMGGIALFQHELAPHIIYAFPWFIWLAIGKNRIKNLSSLFLGYFPAIIIIGGGYFWLRHTVLGSFSGLPDSESASVLINALRILLKESMLPDFGIIWIRILALLKLWLWGMPGLLILSGMGIFAVRKIPVLIVFTASFLLIFLSTFFFSGSQGHGWGFRHLHYCYSSLILLATAAIVTNRHSDSPGRNKFKMGQKAVVGSVILMSILFCNFQRCVQVYQFIGNHLAHIPEHDPEQNSIVFISTNNFYSVDLVQNDPFLQNPVLYLSSNGFFDDKKFLREHFSDAKLSYSSYLGSVWILPDAPLNQLISKPTLK